MNYLVIVPKMSAYSSPEFKIMDEEKIKDSKFYAEVLEIFKLGDALTTEEKLALGLKSWEG